MPKQKVLMTTKLFWPEGGGGELATYLIAKDMLSKHFELTVVSGTRRPAADILEHCKYVWWHLFTEKYKPIEWLKLIENTKQFARLVKQADIVYIPSHTLLPLAIITKRIKPSVRVVVHLHNYQPLTYTSVMLACRGPDMAIDLIVERCEHESLLRAVFAGIGHNINLVNRFASHYADRVICVSRRQAEVISNRAPELKHKIKVVYSPLPETPPLEEKFANPTFTFAGGGATLRAFMCLYGLQ